MPPHLKLGILIDAASVIAYTTLHTSDEKPIPAHYPGVQIDTAVWMSALPVIAVLHCWIMVAVYKKERYI